MLAASKHNATSRFYMPSGEPQLLQKRIISGKGTLQIPQPYSDVRRAFILETRVIRKPINEYMNVTYNPGKSRYANINVMREGSVTKEIHVEYSQQSFDFVADSSAQTLYAVQCSYEGVLKSFANLGEALGLNVISIVNNIKSWKSLDLLWDELLVCCYADTAIELYLFQLEYDVCPDNVSVPQRLGYNIPPIIPVVPGTPLQGENAVSLPYDSNTNDNGNTAPYPIDVNNTTPPTQGEKCVAYNLKLKWRETYSGGQQENYYNAYGVWGELGSLTVNTDKTGILLECRGIGGTCGDFVKHEIIVNSQGNIISAVGYEIR